MTYGILSTINILLKSEAVSSRVKQSAAPKSIDTINNNSFYQIYNTPYRGIAVSLI